MSQEDAVIGPVLTEEPQGRRGDFEIPQNIISSLKGVDLLRGTQLVLGSALGPGLAYKADIRTLRSSGPLGFQLIYPFSLRTPGSFLTVPFTP